MTPLWIGGAPGCGKSTVARILARRHGLRWYNADTRTWAHRDAALAAGDPDAELFESLDPAERWRRPVPELLRMALHEARGPMVAADVRALPAPLTIAEGTPVRPAVTGDDPAIWLLASPGVRRARLAGRDLNPGQLALHLELGDLVEAETAAARVPVLTVDDLGLDEVVTAVERLFAGRLAIGPTAGTPAERAALAREANTAIVEQCRGFAERPWSSVAIADIVRAFGCECGAADCLAEVELSVGDYTAPVLAEGHRAPAVITGSAASTSGG